ncbi:MAG: hypothetical protein J7M18_06700 [Candidatus Eremiobacteraeota bacterium]|nr:hypothetical protein [Candidatus Eremiobacteraeota bacterium]
MEVNKIGIQKQISAAQQTDVLRDQVKAQKKEKKKTGEAKIDTRDTVRLSSRAKKKVARDRFNIKKFWNKFFKDPRNYDMNEYLKAKPYQNITREEAAKMLGHFVQRMQNEGFPWRLSKPGKSGKPTPISDLEALYRLEKGEEVIFEPRKSVDISLNSGDLAYAGSLATPLAPVSTAARFSKKSKIEPGSAGIETKFGKEIVIDSFAELKILHKMFNMSEKVDEGDKIGKAAKEMSYFTRKAAKTSYPWRFYTTKEGTSTGKKIKMEMKRAIKSGVIFAAVGGLLGALIGGPIGASAGISLTIGLLGGAKAGALIGGGLGMIKGSVSSIRDEKGEEISAYEALKNLVEKKPVRFQEKKTHSVGIPFIKKYTWFTDYGKSNLVRDMDELETLHKLEDLEDK